MGVILTALAVPALTGALLVLLGRRIGHQGAAALALLAAGVSALTTVLAVHDGLSVDRPWIASLGVRLAFGSDVLSAPLLLLSVGITLAVVIHGMRHRPGGGSAGAYFGCLLLVAAGALATFWARDLLLFFLAFEIVLIPMWVLISRFGDPHDPAARRDAAARFVLYTALGSTLMLAGILVLVHAAGSSAMTAVAQAQLSERTQLLAALLLVVGLGIKVPLFPVHSWLPAAHTIAPTGGSVLLAAVLLKMGTYGLIRLPVALAPGGVATIAPVLAVLGVAGILWGGLVCLVERDLKRLIAYSSIAHMGFVALALASGTDLGVRAAMLTNVAHGLISALLFFIVGGLKERWGSSDLGVVRPALRERWPRLGLALVFGLAAGLGLPGLAGFWGEILTLVAAWNPSGPPAHLAARAGLGGEIGWWAFAPGHGALILRGCVVAAALGAALAAAYSLRVARLVWVGDESPREPSGDASWAESVVCGALMVAILVLGLFPALVTLGTWSAP